MSDNTVNKSRSTVAKDQWCSAAESSKDWLKAARRSVLKGTASSSKISSNDKGNFWNSLKPLGYQAGYLRNGKFQLRNNNACYRNKLHGSHLKATLDDKYADRELSDVKKFLEKHEYHKTVRPLVPMLTDLILSASSLQKSGNQRAVAVATFQIKSLVDQLKLKIGGAKEYLNRARTAMKRGRKVLALEYYRGAFVAIVKETALTQKQKTKIDKYGDARSAGITLQPKPIKVLKEIGRELRINADKTTAAEVYRYILYDRSEYQLRTTGLHNFKSGRHYLGRNRPLAKLEKKLSKEDKLRYARLLADTATEGECFIGQIEALKAIHSLDKTKLSTSEIGFLKTNGAVPGSKLEDVITQGFGIVFDRYMKRGEIYKARAIKKYVASLVDDPKTNKLVKGMQRKLNSPAAYARELVGTRLEKIAEEKKACSGLRLIGLQREEATLRLALKGAKEVHSGRFSFGSVTSYSDNAKMWILLGALQKSDRLLNQGLRAKSRLAQIGRWDENAKRIKVLHLSSFPQELRSEIRDGKLPPILAKFESKGKDYAWRDFYPTLKWVNDEKNVPILKVYRDLKAKDPEAAARLYSALKVILSKPVDGFMRAQRNGVSNFDNHWGFEVWADSWIDGMSGIEMGDGKKTINKFYQDIAKVTGNSSVVENHRIVQRSVKSLKALGRIEDQLNDDVDVVESSEGTTAEVHAAKQRIEAVIAEMMPKKGTLGSRWLTHEDYQFFKVKNHGKKLTPVQTAAAFIKLARTRKLKNLHGALMVPLKEISGNKALASRLAGIRRDVLLISNGEVPDVDWGPGIDNRDGTVGRRKQVWGYANETLTTRAIAERAEIKVASVQRRVAALQIEAGCKSFIKIFVPAGKLDIRLQNNEFFGLETVSNVARVISGRKYRQKAYNSFADILKRLNKLRRDAGNPSIVGDPKKFAALQLKFAKLMRDSNLAKMVKYAQKVGKSAASHKSAGINIIVTAATLPVGFAVSKALSSFAMWAAARGGMSWGASLAFSRAAGTAGMVIGMTQTQMAAQGNWFGFTGSGEFKPFGWLTALATNVAFIKAIPFVFNRFANRAARHGLEMAEGRLYRVISKKVKDASQASGYRTVVRSAYELGADARFLYKLGLFGGEMAAVATIVGATNVVHADKSGWGFNLATMGKIASTFGNSFTLPELAHTFTTTLIMKGAHFIVTLPAQFKSGRAPTVERRIFLREHARLAKKSVNRADRIMAEGGRDLATQVALLKETRRSIKASRELMKKHDLKDKPQYAESTDMLARIDQALTKLEPMIKVFGKGNVAGVRMTKVKGVYSYAGGNKNALLGELSRNENVARVAEGKDGRVVAHLSDGMNWVFEPKVRWARTKRAIRRELERRRNMTPQQRRLVGQRGMVSFGLGGRKMIPWEQEVTKVIQREKKSSVDTALRQPQKQPLDKSATIGRGAKDPYLDAYKEFKGDVDLYCQGKLKQRPRADRITHVDPRWHADSKGNIQAGWRARVKRMHDRMTKFERQQYLVNGKQFLASTDSNASPPEGSYWIRKDPSVRRMRARVGEKLVKRFEGEVVRYEQKVRQGKWASRPEPHELVADAKSVKKIVSRRLDTVEATLPPVTPIGKLPQASTRKPPLATAKLASGKTLEIVHNHDVVAPNQLLYIRSGKTKTYVGGIVHHTHGKVLAVDVWYAGNKVKLAELKPLVEKMVLKDVPRPKDGTLVLKMHFIKAKPPALSGSVNGKATDTASGTITTPAGKAPRTHLDPQPKVARYVFMAATGKMVKVGVPTKVVVAPLTTVSLLATPVGGHLGWLSHGGQAFKLAVVGYKQIGKRTLKVAEIRGQFSEADQKTIKQMLDKKDVWPRFKDPSTGEVVFGKSEGQDVLSTKPPLSGSFLLYGRNN